MSDQPQWMTPEIRAILADVRTLPRIPAERRPKDMPWDLIRREHAAHTNAPVRATSHAQGSEPTHA